jgi:hypothetical protein
MIFWIFVASSLNSTYFWCGVARGNFDLPKSGFTRRRNDATRGNKGIGLMLIKNYDLQDSRCVVAALREAIFCFAFLNERDFAVHFLTLFYESALMSAMKEGDARWGPACFAFHFHRRPGIDRGGGFCLQASGWSGGAIAVAVVG